MNPEPASAASLSALGALKSRYGNWAVVTGASDGIGRAFACELAAEGFDLVLVARRREQLEALAQQLRMQHAIRTQVLALDLAERGSVQAVAEACAGIDVGLLVAAAGFGTSGLLIAGELDAEIDMIDVNCTAPLVLSTLFARRFVARGRGGLVLMSSLLAFQGVPRAANYAATKAYIQTLAEGLHVELAPAGVDVIVVAPGPIRSGFEARANLRMSMGQTPDVVARETLRKLGHATTVRPGWLAKLLELALVTLPRWGRTRVMQQVMGGMTRHQPAIVAAHPAARS